MAEENNSPPTQRARRSSFAGQTFADLFGTGRPSVSRPDNGQNQAGQFPGPITTAAAQAQQRRLSIATLGLSGSPNSTSPYGSFRGRRESISSANSGSIDESAIEDEPAGAKDINSSTPATPFARRMSFGARAMRDIRTSTGGGGNGGGGSPGQNGRSPPPSVASHARAPSASLTSATNTTGTISSRDAKGRGLSSLHSVQRRPLSVSLSSSSQSSPLYQASFIPFRRLTIAAPAGEGFNWSENLRSRAERGSIAAPGGGQPGMPIGANNHARAKSVATMEPPVQEMPRAASKKPDHFQERILKGDFYMD